MILFLCIVANKSERQTSIRGFNRMHQTLPRKKDFTRLPVVEQVTVCWSLSSLHHIHHDFAKKMNNDFGDKFGDKNNTVRSMSRRNKEIKKSGKHRSKLKENPLTNVDMCGGLNDQKNETLKDQKPEVATDALHNIRKATSDTQQVKYLVLEPGICCTSFSFCNHFVRQVSPLAKVPYPQITPNYSYLQHEFLVVDTNNVTATNIPDLAIAGMLLCRCYRKETFGVA